MTAPGWLARLLFIIAAFCELFAAVMMISGDRDGSAAQAWFYGGLSAAALGVAAS